jgi:hypothetical protein
LMADRVQVENQNENCGYRRMWLYW